MYFFMNNHNLFTVYRYLLLKLPITYINNYPIATPSQECTTVRVTTTRTGRARLRGLRSSYKWTSRLARSLVNTGLRGEPPYC